MTGLKHILSEKRATIPDEEVKERSWIVLFRKNPELEVLLVKDEDGKWSFPGGQLNTAETAEEAAWRELKEETSVVPDKLHFLKTIYHDKENKLKVSHVFYTEVDKDTKIKSASDVEKSKWYPAKEKIDLEGLSKPKKEAIEACVQRMYHYKEELKEALALVKKYNLPVLLTEGKKRTDSGFLVVMEGIDGAGKSTQCKALKKLLERKGWKVTMTEWNTSPHIAKAIRKGKKEKWLSPTLYSLLHASDMVWRYENVIKPALNEGHVVLCDRYHYTSYVRDQLRGMNKEVLDRIYENFAEPNMVLHFKVTPRMAVERLMQNRGFKWYSGGMDIGYSKNLEECASIYESQMDAAYGELLPKAKNYHQIDTGRSIAEIVLEVYKLVKSKLTENKRQIMEEKPITPFKRMVSEMYIHGYELAEDAPTFRVPENFDRYNEGSGWQAYRGGNDWENGTTGVAVYLNPEGYQKEMARIWFEVKFPPHLEEYVSSTKGPGAPSTQAVKKWGDRAARRWMRETVNVRRGTRQYHGAHDGYNRDWVERKPWKECFILALQTERMKPFVKNYGVDRTKWVGMKRSTPTELNESGIPSRSWWMEPDGGLIPVAETFGHAKKGKEILRHKFGVDTENVYGEMQGRGYIRVGFAGMMGQYHIEINYVRSRPPTATQWRALKDLAIEMGASTIEDDSRGGSIRVDESKTLCENFHENKEWFIYEGSNTLTAVFGDNSRQTFKIHFRDQRLREDKEKHRKKAASMWKRLATEIRKSVGLSQSGNPIVIPWQECFQKALEDPLMKEYVDDLRAMPIFESYGGLAWEAWLSKEGQLLKGASHYAIGANYLRSIGEPIASVRDVYDTMYRKGFVRVVVGDNAYPLVVDNGTNNPPSLTRAQREWVQDKSHELGLAGEYNTATGRSVTAEGTILKEGYGWVNYWLDPKGEAHEVWGHEVGAIKILSSLGINANDYPGSVYDQMNKLGYARIVVGDNQYPLMVDTEGHKVRLTKSQRRWIEDKSFELGSHGSYWDETGKEVMGENLNEMTYDELHQSMQDYRTRKDIRTGTKTGADSRDAGATNVNVRSLRVLSTVGLDGDEHETSMFSYKSRSSDPSDPRKSKQRWQGYIRFIENTKGGAVAPPKDKQDVEVNCTCPDYKYVWAKANSDVDAGTTGTSTTTGFSAGGPVSKIEPKPIQQKTQNIFEVGEEQNVALDKRFKFQGGNTNNGTYGKKIRNPQNTPGLCKHLIALAEYIEKEVSPVAPAEPGKEEPSPVAPSAGKSNLKHTGKPVNIFEAIKQFALAHPTFDVPYED